MKVKPGDVFLYVKPKRQPQDTFVSDMPDLAVWGLRRNGLVDHLQRHLSDYEVALVIANSTRSHDGQEWALVLVSGGPLGYVAMSGDYWRRF